MNSVYYLVLYMTDFVAIWRYSDDSKPEKKLMWNCKEKDFVATEVHSLEKLYYIQSYDYELLNI